MGRHSRPHQFRFPWKTVSVLVVVGLLITLGVWFFGRQESRPSKAHYPELGLSLTQADGYQDFQQLQQEGVKFVYLKASQGSDYTDDNFAGNYDRAVGTNMYVGVYHYFSFDTSAAKQAQNFEAAVGEQVGNLPLMVHLEYYGPYRNEPPKTKAARARLKKFIELITAYYGKAIIIQGAPDILHQLVPSSWKNQEWVIQTSKPKKTEKIAFWQYSPTARIPKSSIDQRFALSVFNGSAAQWEAFVRK
ncbi:glycosyl hydrolases 25 family protein [Lactobacillus selangorensis]|uniref:Glycosyl hydrolases 25 family protein n=1 Tax=Lactobacillus selangorensis TaxID=81857 RepID=A0A0R2FI54_9LACO|nr:GH25 family lysozyme [Lactobacillus selangorensis]KRN28322.1 glycosyl hydrolases 25 family protein [Lactobacillus selangorensis]KRN31824.1 glycosyl hydrolases 25 family protein [Lactobacillus selangorensis]